jgi:CheY-like chemotaxis protein
VATVRFNTFDKAETLNDPRSTLRDWPAGHSERASVLIVDQARAIIDVLTRELTSLGLAVVCARAGQEALKVANRVQFVLLLLHLELPDIHGLDVVRALHEMGRQTPFIALTGGKPIPGDAYALGALHVFQEPFDLQELRGAVAYAIGLTAGDALGATSKPAVDQPPATASTLPHDLTPIAEPHTACDRWCNFVTRLATSEHDLKTNEDCASHLGVCNWVFSASCRRVHVTASHTRNFARMLRAIRRSGPAWRPETILDIDDARTLRKFEERSGVKRGRKPLTPSLEEFFERQQWIPRDNPVLRSFERRVLGDRRFDLFEVHSILR